MSGVILRLDSARWREHLRTVVHAVPGIVPVIKGNGYGYGLRRLAEESARLGVDVVGVGTAREVESVRAAFAGDIVILNPWDPSSTQAGELADDRRVISTVSRISDLERLAARDQLPGGHSPRGGAGGSSPPESAQPRGGAGSSPPESTRPRVLVELLTSMRRHGLRTDQLGQVPALLEGVEFEGWTIHLPMQSEGRYAEAERLARAALEASPGTLWLSHLPPEEAYGLARQLGGAGADPVPVRLRIGTRLWLGEESSRQTMATVLDVHPIRRGERAGYRQRLCPADGWILVMAGGTSHGIGMEAPTSATTIRQRAIALATGSLEAAGLALSPYTVNGKKRWFLEPPHMQSSLVFLPAKEQPPAIGEEVPVELRLTTAIVDDICEA
jgi:Alanine racemase, N-terminal domain